MNQYIKKAICQSSGFEKTQRTLNDSRALGREFIKLTGAKSIDDLLKLPAESILEYSLIYLKIQDFQGHLHRYEMAVLFQKNRMKH